MDVRFMMIDGEHERASRRRSGRTWSDCAENDWRVRRDESGFNSHNGTYRSTAPSDVMCQRRK
jgi:hypothetical protein